MKCRNCGYEIPSGELYCKRCGEEVRIVPDYNPLDDMLSAQIKVSINENGEYVLSRAMLWNIPNADLDEVQKVRERTVQTLRSGVELTPGPRGVSNNLPKQSESRVAHVRPHGRDAEDKLPLPDGRMMTNQCFWLNNNYIAEQISK